MKTVAFTPGPWRYEPQDGRQNQRVICLEEIVAEYDPVKPLATVMATAWRPRGKSAVANAHLIAAAPDLYAALYHAHSLMMIADRSQAWREERDKCVAQAEAALAKARGEPR